MKQEAFIYSLIDPITNQIRYIGQTIQKLHIRHRRHINDSKKARNHKECWIKGLVDKSLEPIIEIIDVVYKNDVDFWEQYYISLYKSWGFDLTNLTYGGKTNFAFNNDTKLKMKNSKLKNWGNEEYKKNQVKAIVEGKERDKERLTLINKECVKNMHTPEVRKKANESIKIALNKAEYIESSKKRKKEYWDNITPEVRNKILSAFLSEESKEKKRQNLQLAKQTKEYKEKISKATKDRHRRKFIVTLNGEFVGEWTSIIECATDLKIKSVATISSVLHGRAKTFKGYKAKFI